MAAALARLARLGLAGQAVLVAAMPRGLAVALLACLRLRLAHQLLWWRHRRLATLDMVGLAAAVAARPVLAALAAGL